MKMNDTITVTMENIPEELQPIAEIIGMDKLIELSSFLGGCQFYIPTKNNLIRRTVYTAIKKEFNGGNVRELAQKYGKSERTVHRIIKQSM